MLDTERKSIWVEAGLPGLILGLVPIGFDGLSTLAGSSLLITILLKAVKIFVCIYLLKHFLKKFSAVHEETERRAIFRYGAVIALLSAMVVSFWLLVYMKVIAPDMFLDAIDELRSAKPSPFSASDLAALEETLPVLPTIAFFFNLVYCFLFGVVASAVIAENISSDNPFDGYNAGDQL